MAWAKQALPSRHPVGPASAILPESVKLAWRHLMVRPYVLTLIQWNCQGIHAKWQELQHLTAFVTQFVDAYKRL